MRLDILHAAGAEQAHIIMICVDKPETAVRIAELVKAEFPLTRVIARSYDRVAALSPLEAGVEYQIRETVESAFAFGFAALTKLGIPEQDAAEIICEVRRRDAQRFELQIAEGVYAGRQFFQGNRPVPAPLTTPRRTGRAGNTETASILNQANGRENPPQTP
jgi:glutathione-regulated potassium-efflux system protein KefB